MSKFAVTFHIRTQHSRVSEYQEVGAGPVTDALALKEWKSRWILTLREAVEEGAA